MENKTTDFLCEYPLTLKLTNRDAEKFSIMAGQANMSAAELLENFISDLIDGFETNGSNERDAAKRWFQLVSYWNDGTFLTYLSVNEEIYYVWGLLLYNDNLQEYMTEVSENKLSLEELLSRLEETDEVREARHDYDKIKALYMEHLKEELSYSQDELDIIWKDYQEEYETNETFDEGMQKLREWGSRSFYGCYL